MSRKTLPLGLALAVILGVATFVAAQMTPSAGTTPAPAASLTPGSASLTPVFGLAPASTTPGYGANLYGIPNSTPVGMPSRSITPSPGAVPPAVPPVTAARPMTTVDCAASGWRSYASLGFQSEKACQSWVEQNPPQGIAPAVTPSGRRRASPRARRTPGMDAAVPATTPGSSITPLLNPTPPAK